MKVIGLTGGIGMGKSTAASAFRRACLPVFDADAEVHRLQARGGRAVPLIETAFPGSTRNGAVHRPTLRDLAIKDPVAMATLERILHPMVRRAERRFLAAARRARHPAAILDIPLLLETGGESRVDFIVVVSAPASVQRARVRRRRRMTDAQIAAVIARQMPDRDKRRRADMVVQTGLSRHHAHRALNRLITSFRLASRPKTAALLPSAHHLGQFRYRTAIARPFPAKAALSPAPAAWHAPSPRPVAVPPGPKTKAVRS